MTPAARVQAAIELVDAIATAARENGPAADTLISRWFSTRRYAGSRDRAAVRELVYRAVRTFGDPPASGRAAFVAMADREPELAALFGTGGYGPAPIAPKELRAAGGAMPQWMAELIHPAEQGALLKRAPLDLRVNTLKTDVDAMRLVWPDAESIDGIDALRFAEPFAVERSEPWDTGLVEVQDAGSQWVAAACRAAPEMLVVDLCAGGGGKTLALASAMQGRGRLVACDTDRGRLQRLPPRAERAGAVVETRLLNPGREMDLLADLVSAADVVLVDAPCSGSGTLRRNPETRWRLTPERLARTIDVQARLLDLASGLVRPGGVLVYAVCSLIDSEGAGQVASFLQRSAGWSVSPPFAVGRQIGPGRIVSPSYDGTDGFFVARLESPC